METLKKCLEKLKSSTSDSEKLASMMVVSKISASVDFTEELANSLYVAIGDKFLIKLLKSDATKENGNEFKCIALNVLNCIVQHNSQVVLVDNEDVIVELLNLLSLEATQVNQRILAVLFEILLVLTLQDRSLFIRHNIYMKLKTFLVTVDGLHSEPSLGIIRNLQVPNQALDSKFKSFLLDLACEFNSNQDLKKFDLLSLLVSCFSLLETGELNIELSIIDQDKCLLDMLKQICNASLDILLSKCKSTFKVQVLQLLAKLIELFSIFFIFTQCKNRTKKFVLTLMTVISIETAISYNSLKENDLKDVCSRTENVTLSCTLISQKVIEFICSDAFARESQLSNDNDFVLKVFKCLKRILSSVYDFVIIQNEKLASCLDHPIVVKSILLICLWATEETQNLQDELKSSIPILLNLAKIQLKDTCSSSSSLPDLLHDLIPCISQIFPDETYTIILQNSNCVQIYVSYFNKVLLAREKIIANMQGLIHLLFQAVLLLPQLSFSVLKTLDLKDISTFVLAEMQLEACTYYKLELSAFYFNLCANISVDDQSNLVDVIIRFCQLDQLHLDDESYNMWVIAIQNIIECIKSHRLKLPSSNDHLDRFIKQHVENNEQKVLVEQFKQCLKI